MAQDEFVDGDGWISDESSFYGDEDARAACELAAHRPLKRAYHPPVPQAARKNIKTSYPPASSSGSVIIQPNDKPSSETDILSFLKSRPQIAALGKKQKTAVPSNGSTLLTDRVEVPDRFAGRQSAWQRNETIEAFLLRNPVGDPSTAISTLDGRGWLWVGSPTMPRAQVQKRKPCDEEAFERGSYALLEAFENRRAAVEKECSGKAPGTITKKLTPHREELECELLAHAVSTGMTSGKWMLFPRRDDLPYFWRAVATATSEGRLGSTSKSAVYDPDKPETLICVYNDDFSDSDEVRRVLKELVNLNLCHAGGKPIYYKCDAYTHLNIFSDNRWKLRASLYSSKEILNNETKAFASGPVSRLKKRNMERDVYSVTGDDIS